MPLCRDSAMNFGIFFWLKCAAAAAGVICVFVHYSRLITKNLINFCKYLKKTKTVFSI